MPDITNPQAVVFANQYARVFAESLLSTIQTARVLVAMYNAQNGDNLFTNVATDLVVDGSEIDGRPRISGQAVRQLLTAANDILSWAATGTPSRETRLRGLTHKGESKI